MSALGFVSTSLVCAAALSGLSLASVRAQSSELIEPSAQVQEQYRDVVERAVAEFDAGRFAEASALFSRAHELWPSARTFRVLGMTAFELRSYVRALRALTAALADARRPLDDEHRREVQALIERTQEFVGRYHVRPSPEQVSLQVDGNPVQLEFDGSLLLEVGNHELLARADGYAPLRQQLFVEGRNDRDLAVELAPLPSASTEPAAQAPALVKPAPPPAAAAATPVPDSSVAIWPWTLGGAVVTGGASLTVFLVAEAKAECDDKPARCTQTEISEIHTMDAVSVTLVSVSGALLVTTALLLLYGRKDATTVAIDVGPTYLGARGRF
jgi:hypothetical protein